MTALVYEFMSNGRMDEWLPLNSTSAEVRSHLSLVQLVNIAVDVVCTLDYLHHSGATPIIHCDLKPSNVLFDKDMTGHVRDFGLARFIPEAIQRSLIEQSSSVGIKGSIGYILLQNTVSGVVSSYGDIHSFGILLLEMFMGKRRTNDMFGDRQNLRSVVKAVLESHAVEDIIASSLFDDEEIEYTAGRSSGVGVIRRVMIQECLVSIVEIGVRCPSEEPRERGDVFDVVRTLIGARNKLEMISQ